MSLRFEDEANIDRARRDCSSYNYLVVIIFVLDCYIRGTPAMGRAIAGVMMFAAIWFLIL